MVKHETNHNGELQPDSARERLARRLIDEGIAKANGAGKPVTDDVARVLAAALHRGPRSPLERFAASGRLNRRNALRELNRAHDEIGAHATDTDTQVIERRNWMAALRAHIESRTDAESDDSKESDRPGAHGRPSIFVIPSSSETQSPPGAWVDAARAPFDLLMTIGNAVLHDDSPAMGWTIASAAGFFDLDIPSGVGISHLSRASIGITDYGEAYAAFVDWQGWETSDEEFIHRYVGTYQDAESMSRDFIERQDWSCNLAAFIEQTQIPVQVEVDLGNVAEALQTQWHIVQGSAGLHAFRQQ